MRGGNEEIAHQFESPRSKEESGWYCFDVKTSLDWVT